MSRRALDVSPRATRWIAWAWPVLLGVVGFALYANALGNPFIADDTALLGENAAITRPTLAGLGRLWTISYTQGFADDGRVISLLDEDSRGELRTVYRPVTTSSYWLTSAVAGPSPLGFRVVNVALHVLAAWLLGLWIREMLGTPAAIVASLLVLVHPLATDVVNRISGRADILALVGVAGFLWTQRIAARAGWTWWRLLIAALWVGVALGAKESGLIVVPLALLQLWMAPARAARGMIAVVVPLIGFLTARALVLHFAPYRFQPEWDLFSNPLIGKGPVDRLPAVAALTFDYVRMLLVPWPLFAFDSPVALPTWSDPSPWIGAAALAGIVGSGVALALRRHPLAFAAAWFLAVFLMVGHLLTPIMAYREVRFAYAMLAALALLVAWLAAWVSASGMPARALAATIGLVVVAIYGSLVMARNRDFVSLRTVVETDLRQRPASAAAVSRVAKARERDGRLEDANALFERACELAPWSTQALDDLGAFQADHGRRADAKRTLQRAVQRAPSYVGLLTLSRIALDENDLDAAERYLEGAARLTPDDPYVGYNLAVLADKRGDRAGAIARLEAILARDPAFGLARAGLAQIR